MTQEIEIEFKNMLTGSEYEQLLNYYNAGNRSHILQRNHYFETKDFQLKQNRAALRIREKNNTYQLTLKQPNPNGAGLLETHCTITEKEADKWIDEDIIPKRDITDALNEMNIDIHALKYGGMLETKRIEFTKDACTLVLDKSNYNGHTDYELELEATDETHGYQVFEKLLATHQIPKRQTANKIERFYQTVHL
ncbi:CYTH domain-containing protein [Gracilibacillus caseinilyticus]|uniref:CYTH domain-containing protein n=1 Tax=Gracilibacillus caseinilyticus TaxID=2932256 RepID=A0ABY4EST9_9BACI|nr:CYTH domain-containing protein [Gracilibacillus caseinilyticus]UOQ46938.1 CYTH domain-containing protein [Gracilibacillus caseinilyticus]